ncbi:MAG: hypothetical protein IJ494_06005 [Bacteroides sp.]|nr:hypothetical protein [Bacteroides sp.]
MKWDGFDYWAISFTANEIFGYTSDYAMKQKRCGILYKIIANMVANGTIVEPEDLRTGIDFVTNLRAGNRYTDPNFCWNRGFPFSIYEHFGVSGQGLVENTSVWGGANTSISYYRGENNHEYFLNYIRCAMWFTPDEFATKYPASTYPLIAEKYELVVNYLLETYGMDLVKMAEGPQAEE